MMGNNEGPVNPRARTHDCISFAVNSTMVEEAFWKPTDRSFGRRFVGSETYVQSKWQFQQEPLAASSIMKVVQGNQPKARWLAESLQQRSYIRFTAASAAGRLGTQQWL